jgi:RNA polymerase sigma factor (sigma-70 family)
MGRIPKNQDLSEWLIEIEAQFRRCATSYNKNDVDDAIQEANLYAVKKERRLRRLDDPESYLRTKVLNFLRNEYRKRVRRENILRENILRRKSEEAPQNRQDLSDEVELIKLAIQTLPKEQRLLIERVYYEGEAKGQIAREFGVSAATVSGWLRKARSKIERFLQKRKR